VQATDTTSALEFRGLEAELLEETVRLELFNSKSEAIRAAIMKYAVERKNMSNRLKSQKPREVSPDELESDLQSLEEHLDWCSARHKHLDIRL